MSYVFSKPTSVVIERDANGKATKVTLDGMQLSCLQSVVVSHNADMPCETVTFSLAMCHVEYVDKK